MADEIAWRTSSCLTFLMKARAEKRQFPSICTLCVSNDGDGTFWHKTILLVGRIICEEQVEDAAESSGNVVGDDTDVKDEDALDTDVVVTDEGTVDIDVVEAVEESGCDLRWFFHSLP